MAPHAIIDPHDLSDYYPSIKSTDWLQSAAAHTCLNSSITDSASVEKDSLSKRFAAFSRQDQCVWHLSPEEIEGIEDSVRYFLGMHRQPPAQLIT